MADATTNIVFGSYFVQRYEGNKMTLIEMSESFMAEI
jgi:hypothetical protein